MDAPTNTRRAGLGSIALTTISLVLTGSVPAVSAAQEQRSPQERFDSLVNAELARREAESRASRAPRPPSPTRDSGEAALAYADSAALAEYARWGVQHTQRVFEWQLSSSRIIFVFVHLLVFSGVLFSGIQFYRSIRRPPTAMEERGAEVSQIELSWGKVKITSPVLGVVILGLSIAFFYLYLLYVYPISETF